MYIQLGMDADDKYIFMSKLINVELYDLQQYVFVKLKCP